MVQFQQLEEKKAEIDIRPMDAQNQQVVSQNNMNQEIPQVDELFVQETKKEAEGMGARDGIRPEKNERVRDKFQVWMESQVGMQIKNSIKNLELQLQNKKSDKKNNFNEQNDPTTKDEVAERIEKNERMIQEMMDKL